jgi:hypothetical protein
MNACLWQATAFRMVNAYAQNQHVSNHRYRSHLGVTHLTGCLQMAFEFTDLSGVIVPDPRTPINMWVQLPKKN